MKTKILDTTIRDGSYAVNFKFSCKDVKDLVEKSRKIGIEYIEVGHGQGLNASAAGLGRALQTDEEYIMAAKNVAGDSQIGVFCIPGIARAEDISIAKKCGVDFIRIGVPVSEYKKSFEYIDLCNNEGIKVFVNFMKTHTASPKDFGMAVKEVSERDAFGVYIVDSAGSMTENEIGHYIDATREKSDIRLGFHGHNNLGLAVSNSLYCINRDLEFVDCSFQGLGRSLGNASLEQLVMALGRLGITTDFDIPRVLEYGYAGLRNIIRTDLVNPLDYVCGYAGFHSSFIKDIYRCCCEKMVDPLRLIIAYSSVNQITMDYEKLCEVADTLSKDEDDNPYGFGDYFADIYYD